MPTPLVHGLLPTACLLATAPTLPKLDRRTWLRLLFLAVILGNAPDVDLVPAMFFPSLWTTLHRNFGHNLFAVSLWISLGALAIRRWAAPQLPLATAAMMAAGLVLSHLAFDAMTLMPEGIPQERGGVPLLFPFTTTRWYLPWRVFPAYEAAPNRHPAIAYAVANDYWHRVFILEFARSLGLLAIFASSWYVPRAFRRLFTRASGRYRPSTNEST